jgi:hypothetical protein
MMLKLLPNDSLGGQRRISTESNVGLKNTGRGNTRYNQFERREAGSALNSRIVRVRSDTSNLFSVILMFRHKVRDTFSTV